jgi:antitoxin HicB
MDTKKLNKYLSYIYPIELTFIPENEGGGVAARIPFLGKDAFIGDGETIDQALINLNRVKDERFKEYIENGIEIPLPPRDEDYSGKFVVRVPKSLHRHLAEYAKANAVSLNTLCVSLLAKNFNEVLIESDLKRICSDITEIKTAMQAYKYTDSYRHEIKRPVIYVKDWSKSA